MTRKYVTNLIESFDSISDNRFTIAEKSYALSDTILDEIMNMIENGDLELNFAEEHGLYKMLDVVRQHQAYIAGVLRQMAKKEKK